MAIQKEQSLETDRCGIQVCEAVVERALNDDLRVELADYLDQTLRGEPVEHEAGQPAAPSWRRRKNRRARSAATHSDGELSTSARRDLHGSEGRLREVAT